MFNVCFCCWCSDWWFSWGWQWHINTMVTIGEGWEKTGICVLRLSAVYVLLFCLTLNNPCHLDIVPWFLRVFFTTSDFPTDLRCPPSDRPLTIIHHTLYDHPLTIIHHTHYSIIKLFSQNCWPLYIEDDLGTSSNISYMEDIVIFKCCNLNYTCLLYRRVKTFHL